MKIKTQPLNWSDLKNGVEIDIPITEKTKAKFSKGLTDLFRSKVTIYNDIPQKKIPIVETVIENGIERQTQGEYVIEERHFDRFVIDLCNIQGGFVNKTNGTIENIVNAKTVITKDVARYKSPLEYSALPVDEREDFYTVQIGDFVVLAEVDDVVTTAQEFSQLQQKYKDNSIRVISVSANINCMDADNITMTNA